MASLAVTQMEDPLQGERGSPLLERYDTIPSANMIMPAVRGTWPYDLLARRQANDGRNLSRCQGVELGANCINRRFDDCTNARNAEHSIKELIEVRFDGGEYLDVLRASGES